MFALRLVTTYLSFPQLYLLVGTAAENVNSNQKCLPGINTPGLTLPLGDIVLEVGTPLEIYCVLDLDNPLAVGYTADDIIFKNASQRIDQRYVQVLNTTTARLYIENLPISSEMLYCSLLLRGSSADANSVTDESERLVCLNSVVVGNKPKNVTNFTCISHNWETLNCTWQQPYNGIKTNYSVFYLIPGRPSRNIWFNCPYHEEGKCGWTAYTQPKYRRTFEYMDFQVEGTNKFGNSSQQFRIHHYAQVLPAAPRSLTAISKTSSSILLRWSIGVLQIFEKGLDYKVKYRWSSAPSWNITMYGTNDVTKDEELIRINVTDLKYANLPYDFQVYMKSSVAFNDNSWSPAATLVAKTKPCKPFVSPQTDIGSFEMHRQQSNHRDVNVYWKQLPEEEHNGDDFRYEIRVFEEDREVNVEPVWMTSSYAQFTNLSPNEYRFLIKSVNSEGSAPNSSFVYVPRTLDVIPEPVLFTKVDFSGGIYELSWRLANSADHRVAYFTVFWCESDREQPYECDTVINWVHLPANQTNYSYNFTAKANSGHQFAISANSNTSSSGMVWAMCTVLHHEVNKIRNVWVSKSGSTYIYLQWTLECSERVKGIKGYNITYCETLDDDKTKCRSVEKTFLVYGDATLNHGNITNLEPFTNYKISVAIFTNRLSGPPSDAMYNRTSDAAPNVEDVKVDIENIRDTSAIVRWNAPTITNGIIDHYEVHYNDEMITVNDTTVVLKKLAPYTSYNIRVMACTAYCAGTERVAMHTKIGQPGEVVRPTTEKVTSSRAKLKWYPPSSQTSPNTVYEVVVQFDGPDKNTTVEQFETTDTEATVEVPCRTDIPHLAYNVYVRAKNIDDSVPKNVKEYVGPWSSAYTIDCMHEGLSATWKIMIGIFGCVFLISVFGFFVQRYKQMKLVRVVLPHKFDIVELSRNNIIDGEYHVNIRSRTVDNEGYHINKLSDIDQSSIDCSDMDMNTDETTSVSCSDYNTKLPEFALPRLSPNEIEDPAYHVSIHSLTDGNEGDHLNKLSDIDQSDIDCIHMDMNTDRKTSVSSNDYNTKLPEFALPRLSPNEIEDPAYHVNVRSLTDGNEGEHLNKLSDIDQSIIDCINTNMNTDRTNGVSSSGC